MNAGAYGGEMVQVLKEVTVLTKEGEIKTLKAEELELGYRTSNVLKNEYVVLEGVIALKKGNKEEIKAKMDEYALARKTKQPLEYPSAGSTFKRPEGYFAGKLIQDAGLKGYQVGDAQVSEKHSGFVINRGNATASDVMQLISDVKDKVKRTVWSYDGARSQTCWKVLKRSSTDEICNCNRNVRSRKKQCIKDIRRCWIFLC